MKNPLNATTSLLLLSLTISTRRLKLKTYKGANQFKTVQNITQAGFRKINKITTNKKIFLLLDPNNSWKERLHSWLENYSTFKRLD